MRPLVSDASQFSFIASVPSYKPGRNVFALPPCSADVSYIRLTRGISASVIVANVFAPFFTSAASMLLLTPWSGLSHFWIVLHFHGLVICADRTVSSLSGLHSVSRGIGGAFHWHTYKTNLPSGLPASWVPPI